MAVSLYLRFFFFLSLFSFFSLFFGTHFVIKYSVL
jgi:hypothetical protein